MSLEVEREQTVQLLCRQFAEDALTTPELEKRLEAAYRASSPAELQALLAGLPALPPADAGARGGLGGLARRRDASDSTDISAVTPRAQRLLAIMGSVKKRGDWEPARETRAVVLFGEIEIDLRDARIPSGVTHIDVHAAFGTVRIIIPPGMHVECDGTAIMAEFTAKTAMSAGAGVDAPIIRVTGTALCAEVKVVVRVPEQ